MSESETATSKANSIRQKRVLEMAEKKPNASLSEISEEIPSATTDYVDRILDRFGDPAESAEESPNDSQLEDAESKTNKQDNSQSKHINKDKMSKETPPTSPPTILGTDSNSAGEPDQTGVTRESEQSNVTDNLSGSQEEAEEIPDPDNLTQKERETLRAIHYKPAAAQKEIANMLGVSRATVSNRVNAISGFNWSNRGSFVKEIFDEEIIIDDSIKSKADQSSTEKFNSNGYNQDSAISGSSNSKASKVVSKDVDDNSIDSKAGEVSQAANDQVDQEVSTDVAEIASRINEVERCLDRIEDSIEDTDSNDDALFNDSGLLHKVIHACIDSDVVSEEEELKIIQAITD